MIDKTRPDAKTTLAAQAMRRQAEDIVRATAAGLQGSAQDLSPQAMHRALHELQVHQIELEMQNEELRRAQLELDASREQYFDLYDLAPVAYCTVSEAGLILQANFAAATLLGMTRSSLVGQRISRYIVAAHQDTYYLCNKRMFASGEPQAFELQMSNGDGAHFWVAMKTTLVRDANGAPVQRMVLHDITSAKSMAAAVQEKNTELSAARLVADKANQAKSDFLSSMSHELRTPLSAILGFAQLLDGGTPAPTPSQKRRIDQILQAGWYLLDLINEILDLARIESGKLSLSMQPTPLDSVLSECEAMVGPQADKRGIRVSFAAPGAAYTVQADPKRIKQVLVNLLSNAIKYNKAGGTVTVTCNEATPQRVRISVEDTGAGLAPEKIAQLFQPFNRLGQEESTEEGTGIGLVMTKRLVEMMGGEIGVQSTVGTGSVFWVELNFIAAPPKFADADATPVACQTPPTAEPVVSASRRTTTVQR